MSDTPDESRRSHADGPLTLAVWLSIVAVVPPYLRVVDSGPWTLGVAVLAAALLGIGYLARRRRLPAIAVTLLELLAWTLLLTVAFFRDTALVWVIPTPDTIEAVRLSLQAAGAEIQNGAAPLPAGTAISVLLVGAMGLLTIVIDHVVLSARLPLLAAVGLIAVTLIPPVVVPGSVDIPGFVFLAVAILLMVRAETRGRQRTRRVPTAGPRGRSVSATAFGIGAVAVIVALIATPLLPQPVYVGAFTAGSGATISASLALGDDLRRPREVQVLTTRTSASDAPYLRAATLTDFDGAVWRPDRLRGTPIAESDALGAVTVADGIQVEEVTTTVQIVNLASPWLPVPSPATAVSGLEGAGWLGVPYNRTVVSAESTTQRESYTVTAEVPRPTLDQIRALRAGGDVPDETRAVPADLPPIIGELAADVTAGAGNDYDRLTALQSWFRGADFEYSLDTPVEDGFDGSGAEAVAEFLTQRQGYCIHFASAFALMARTLGMPSRIVVGYLPGQPTNDTIDRRTVYATTSGQLHAWPEVYFEGVGWVAWEPTKSLGVATAFSATASVGDTTEEATLAPTPTATAPTDSPLDRPDEDVTTTDASGATGSGPGSAPWVLLAIVGALLIPALVRAVQSWMLVRAARRGDAGAAWDEVRATALDLGLLVSISESPRALGVRLAGAGAPPGAVSLLVARVERASYAPSADFEVDAEPVEDDPLADAVLDIRQGLMADAGRARAALAVLVPRSLVVRPASASVGS